MGAPLASHSASATQGDADAYFRALQEAFLAAGEAAGGVVEHDLRIGPARVRLRFAGEALAPIMLPALEHLLTSEAGEPTLTLCVWDSGTTGTEVPAFPWQPRDLRQRGEVGGYNDERFRTVYHGDVMDPELGFNALSMLDGESRTGVFWVHGLDRLPWTESAEPLRPLLHWGLMDESCHLLHAGAIANDDGGVLLGGAGGSGKSTSALACIDAGFKFVSDNYLLMTIGERPIAHSIFCTAKIRPEGIHLHSRIRDLMPEVAPDSDEKYVLDLHRHMPERLALSTPIDALLLPRLSDSGRVSVRPTTAAQGLLALAPSTIYQLPSSRGVPLGPMSEVVRRVPTYELELGGPPEEVPSVIAELLAERRAA